MITSPAPVGNSRRLYDEVRRLQDNPEAGIFRALARQVKGAYAGYSVMVANVTAAARPLVLTGAQGNALRLGWGTIQRAAFQYIRANALLASAGLCSLCGSNKAGELDHYLPKKYFPEFSFLPDNLISACGRCNKKKGSRYSASSGAPRFWHPHFHTLPQADAVVCDVNAVTSLSLTFKVSRASGMSPGECSLLQNHFTELALDELYSDDGIVLLGEMLQYLYIEDRAGGPDAVSEYLRKQAHSVRSYHRPVMYRHWKAVMFEALAASTDFCNGGYQLLGPEDPMV